MVDKVSCDGGTGVYDVTWQQQWVECKGNDCQVVWSASLLDESLVSFQNMLSLAYTIKNIDYLDPDTFQVSTEHAGIIAIAQDYPSESSFAGMESYGYLGPKTTELWKRQGRSYESTTITETGIITISLAAVTNEAFSIINRSVFSESQSESLNFKAHDQKFSTEEISRTDFLFLPT